MLDKNIDEIDKDYIFLANAQKEIQKNAGDFVENSREIYNRQYHNSLSGHFSSSCKIADFEKQSRDVEGRFQNKNQHNAKSDNSGAGGHNRN